LIVGIVPCLYLGKIFEPGFNRDKARGTPGPVLKTRGPANRPGLEGVTLNVVSLLPCQRFVSAKLRRPTVSEVAGVLLIDRVVVNPFDEWAKNHFILRFFSSFAPLACDSAAQHFMLRRRIRDLPNPYSNGPRSEQIRGLQAMELVHRWAAAKPSAAQTAAAFCLLYSAVAFMLFPSTFLEVLGAYPIVRYYFVIPPLLFLGLLAAALSHSPRRPITFMKEKLQARGLGAFLIICVLIISATAFTTLKHEYSFLVPFHADHLLAVADRLLHFGDPWTYARALWPEALDLPLYSLYSHLWFVQVVAVVLYAAFVADTRDRERYFISFALTCILLSSVVRIAGSSAGPVFYDRLFGSERFADLTASLQASVAGPRALALTDYLYQSYSSHRSALGTGISAMPSLHVAIAFLNALFISSRSLWVGRVAWAYAALILFGSVYFGWHYALDGYASIICVLIIWRLASRTENQQDARIASTNG
jgi:hypothetical protein